jgi:SAM-dependent MidA family methyltransferase
MGLALGHSDHGYYRTRDPLGRGGDFTTAPEISQMFGEMIGAWCMMAWQAMGRPDFTLVEFGPGRGTLMADLLRVAGKVMPDFTKAARLHLVETSPALRSRQAECLSVYEPVWHESIEDVPQGPSLFVMNEFFDALPIRQFVTTDAGLAELCVGIDPESDRLAFVMERAIKYPLPDGRGLILETCPAALAIVRELSARIARHGGAALIVDYGYDTPGGGGTFQAVKAHAYADPLADPGEADLTAHVDFGALAEAARQAGVTVQGPVGQGEFLLSLGIAERAAKLGTEEALGALHRLTAPEQMGTLFKVLALTKESFLE